MEYIDKSRAKDANLIIDGYLAETRNDHTTAKELYAKMGSSKHNGVSSKHQLIDDILLPEQQYKCCYCMRRLENHSDVLLEHIIPQTTDDDATLNRYFATRTEVLTEENICLTNDHIGNGAPAPPPYPHKVSYHNFAASCASSGSCNRKRGDDFIEPLFLYREITQEVVYDEITGEANWANDPVYNDSNAIVATLETLGINCTELKLIRALWKYASRNNILLDAVEKSNRSQILYELWGEIIEKDPNIKSEAFMNLDTDLCWKKILLYDYFK